MRIWNKLYDMSLLGCHNAAPYLIVKRKIQAFIECLIARTEPEIEYIERHADEIPLFAERYLLEAWIPRYVVQHILERRRKAAIVHGTVWVVDFV